MFSMFSKSLFVHVTMTAAVFHFCPLNLCPALAQTVEDQEEIVLGMSTALTGPAAELGLNVRQGFLAAIREVNESGGIGGRRVRLISRDDGYEPSRTVPNMHKLVDEDRVLAVVGNVGTPTAVAAIPIAMDGQTPFYGAFTGAGVLRKTPPDRYVINYRASYADETRAMVDALIQNFGRLGTSSPKEKAGALGRRKKSAGFSIPPASVAPPGGRFS